MVYLRSFCIPDQDMEDAFLGAQKRTCYPTKYPFHVFRYRNVPQIDFEPITIFCGGNGSGKSTLLNVLAEKLRLYRTAAYNRSPFFGDYVERCVCEYTPGTAISNGRIITSDDVFDYLLHIRALNENLDDQREKLLAEYKDVKYSNFRLRSLDDYEVLKRQVDAQRKTASEYAKSRLMEAVPEHSNGESALQYFTESIQDHALYLLDEPENSLSAQNQLELKSFLQYSVRFFGCQFVISTHSPFLLSLEGAKIYDLDRDPPCVKAWTELESVQIYRKFFLDQNHAFKGGAV